MDEKEPRQKPKGRPRIRLIILGGCVLLIGLLAGFLLWWTDKPLAAEPEPDGFQYSETQEEAPTPQTSVEETGPADLVAFLESGDDEDTGLPFMVGSEGNLISAPTRRIQALDWLGRQDPESARAYARIIFESSTVPGEWAIALRNYGHQLEQPAADPGYVAAIQKLITNPDWQANPTRGYLEAFDAAVHCAAPELLPDLIQVCRYAPHSGTQMAATMALDNIAGDHPERVASVITEPGSAMDEMPAFRASLMARLDPAKPAQVSILREYLLDEACSAEELAAFAEAFPNFNDFAGDYLLTRQPPRQLAVMAWTDLTALRLAREWRADPAFENRMEFLETLTIRLDSHVQSAIRGGILPAEVQR